MVITSRRAVLGMAGLSGLAAIAPAKAQRATPTVSNDSPPPRNQWIAIRYVDILDYCLSVSDDYLDAAVGRLDDIVAIGVSGTGERDADGRPAFYTRTKADVRSITSALTGPIYHQVDEYLVADDRAIVRGSLIATNRQGESIHAQFFIELLIGAGGRITSVWSVLDRRGWS